MQVPRRMLDSLELELQEVMSCQVGDGLEHGWVLYKNGRAPNCCHVSSSILTFIFFKFKVFKKNLCVCVCVCVCARVRTGMCIHDVMMCMYRSEDVLCRSLLSFHHVVPGDHTQVVRLGIKYLQ